MTDATTVLESPAATKVQAEIRVETVTDYASFMDLEPVWKDVLARASVDHPFLEFDWVRTWWECFGAGSDLHILVVKSGERTIAIAPLIVTPIRMWGIKVRRLGFFYNAHVPRAEFIVAERPEEAYRAIWSYLARDRGWDLLQLCQLPDGCATLEELSRLAGAGGYCTGLWESDASPYVPVDSSWGEYFDGLATKHRSNLRNRFKRLKAIGPVEVETMRSKEELAEGMIAGLQLEAAAWKGEAKTAISCDPAISRFYSTVAGRAAERGWIRLHFLRAGDTRIAFDFSLVYKDRVHLLKLGYDPGYSHLSPSNLLLCLVLQGAFERVMAEYEFLGANAEWKRCWAKHVKRHYWLFVFRGSMKGRVLHFLKFRVIPLLKQPRLHHIRSFLQRVADHWPKRGVQKDY